MYKVQAENVNALLVSPVLRTLTSSDLHTTTKPMSSVKRQNGRFSAVCLGPMKLTKTQRHRLLLCCGVRKLKFWASSTNNYCLSLCLPSLHIFALVWQIIMSILEKSYAALRWLQPFVFISFARCRRRNISHFFRQHFHGHQMESKYRSHTEIYGLHVGPCGHVEGLLMSNR